MLSSDHAICIRLLDYSETSQILTIFTRNNGLIRVIAKGSHRATKAGSSKFDGGVDLLDEGACVFTDRLEKDLNILTEWKVVDGRRWLRTTLRPLHLSLYLAELISDLIEVRDPQPELYQRYAWTLDQFNTPAIEEAAIALVIDLLQISGYLPLLDRCVACERDIAREKLLFFLPSRGGVVCSTCEGALPGRMVVDPRPVAIARMILGLPRSAGAVNRLPRLTRAQSDPLHAMLISHVQHLLSRSLNTRRYVMAPERFTRPLNRQPITTPQATMVDAPDPTQVDQ